MKELIPYLISGCLAVAFCFVAPEKALSQNADLAGKDNTYVKGMTAGRARAIVAATAGLISLIVGMRAKVRPVSGRRTAFVALMFGAAAIFLSIAHLISTTGGFGTGGGKAGDIVALALGLAGSCVSGFVLTLKKK